MRKTIRIAVLVVAAGGLGLLTPSPARATPSADGVFFIHGTSDQSPPTSAATDFKATGGSAISDYWTQSSLDTMATSTDGTGQWAYGVAGYQGASQNGQTSWGTVADQLYDFYWSGNNYAIYNVVAVTHSNGSNPVRYLLAHPTAVTPKGRTAQTVISVIKKVVFLAPDNMGTQLADKVTSSGSLAAIGNSIYTFFGGSSWNNAAVWQQRRDNMATYNGNGTFAGGSSPGGMTTTTFYGTGVYAAIWSGDAWCGGYGYTTGLYAAALYAWGSTSAGDGFIPIDSGRYVGVDGGGDGRLNHNQSRRSCHGVGGRIAGAIHGALGGAFTSIPPDYTVSPAVQACNATTQQWDSSNTFYRWGCSSAMQSDTNTDIDCFAAYGGDNGYVAPADFGHTAYASPAYYSASAGGCSDSWLGDGECDLCLVAKYGSDAANGGAGPDDCVNHGAGSSNSCADILWNAAAGHNGYYSYTQAH
jgi:hypothetical protein